MKVGELLAVYEAFESISNKEVSFATALTVAENMELLKTPYEVAKKKENSIIQAALELDESGQPIQLGPNSYKTKEGVNAHAEIDSLMEEEVTVSTIKKISRADIEKITIKPKTIMALKPYMS